MLSPGEVIHICVSTTPEPKYKFLICIDFADGFYLYISTDPGRNTGSSVPILRRELPALAYDSHVGLEVMAMDRNQVSEALEQDERAGKKGSIDASAADRIIQGARRYKVMPRWHKRRIDEALSQVK